MGCVCSCVQWCECTGDNRWWHVMRSGGWHPDVTSIVSLVTVTRGNVTLSHHQDTRQGNRYRICYCMRCAVNIWGGLRSRTVLCPWIRASDDPIFWLDGTCRENTKETPVTRCAPGWDNILKSFSFYHLLCVSLNGLYKPPHSEWVHQFSYEHRAGASVMVIVKQWQDGLVISRAGRLQLNKEHQQMWSHPFLFGI